MSNVVSRLYENGVFQSRGELIENDNATRINGEGGLIIEGEFVEADNIFQFRHGNGLSFDGVDDNVSFSNFTSITQGDFTVELWCDIAQLRHLPVAFSQGIPANWSADLFIIYIGEDPATGSGRYPVRVYWDGGSVLTWNEDYFVGAGPTHFALVKSGSDFLLYVNGEFKIQETKTGLWTSTSQTLGCAVSSTGNTQFYEDILYEVRTWNVARTAKEIQDNMHTVLTGNETGLVGLWEMNEGTEGTIADKVSTNDGTINGASWVDKPIDAISEEFVEHSDRYLKFVDESHVLVNAVNLPSEWTIEFWSYAEDVADGKWNTATRGYADDHQVILNSTTGELGGYFNASGSQFLGCGYDGTLLEDEWHHIAVVGAGGSQDYYVDGSFVGSVAEQSTTDINSIGNLTGTSTQNWGRMRDVRVWDHARTPAEIVAGMNSWFSGLERGMIAYWRFDETAGSFAYDSSANGHHGSHQGPVIRERLAPLVISDMSVYTDGTDDYVDIPPASVPSGDEATIMFWLYGIEEKNATVFDGSVADPRNSNDEKTYNIHLPWGNGSIYFDSGNGVDPIDRIQKAYSSEIYLGWHHWAFTKNAVTGEMKIYNDGELWHSGTGNTLSVPASVIATMGCQVSIANFSHNLLAEFSTFNVELSEADIQKYMYKPLEGNETGLLAYWKLNDGSGSTAVDSGPNSYDAPLVGASWKALTRIPFPSVPMRHVLDFNAGDYVESVFKGIGGTNPRTIEFWFKADVDGKSHRILAWGDNQTGIKYNIRTDTGRGGTARIEVSGGHKAGDNTQRSITDLQWHHVAVTFPSGATDVIAHKIYIDGIEYTAYGETSQVMNTDTSSNLRIGTITTAQGGIAGDETEGKVSDIRIWDHERTAQQIRDNMNFRLNGNETGLVFYVKANENMGNTTIDHTSNNNDGTITGADWLLQDDLPII